MVSDSVELVIGGGLVVGVGFGVGFGVGAGVGGPKYKAAKLFAHCPPTREKAPA